MTADCSHLESIQFTELPEVIAGCEDCLASGSWWVHLRMCQSCRHIGCCDGSPNRHASAHARIRGHPIIRSAEPGENWSYCYLDDLTMVLDRSAAARPSNGAALPRCFGPGWSLGPVRGGGRLGGQFPGGGAGRRLPGGSGPKAKPAIAPSAANAAAASSTSLSPPAVPARAAWVTAARAAGGTMAATRVPAPEATAAASRWTASGGARAGPPGRAGWRC